MAYIKYQHLEVELEKQLKQLRIINFHLYEKYNDKFFSINKQLKCRSHIKKLTVVNFLKKLTYFILCLILQVVIARKTFFNAL